MLALQPENTIVLNKESPLPEKGIICAHPGRVRRIAQEFLSAPELHTDYRGYQVYSGLHKGQAIFVANTGIGAPAAAFLLEELISFGARRIIRLGSNDAHFKLYGISIIERTTLPLGLCLDYGVPPAQTIQFHRGLAARIVLAALASNLPLTRTLNRHIDGYYAVNFQNKDQGPPQHTSSDMESGALYLLGEIYGVEYATLLLSYPKHNHSREYDDNGRSAELEARAIELALDALVL